MAKKVRTRPGAAGPAPAAARRSGRWFFALFAVALLAAGAAWWWHGQTAREKSAALPLMPDLAEKPAALRQALSAAQARATDERAAPAAVVELGRLYHANSFNREAFACWQLLRQAEPREARWCYYLADVNRALGDEDGFRAGLGLTVQLAPDYAPAWLQRADLEFKTGHLDVAETAYRRRLALVPADPYAQIGLARLALQRGQRDEGTRLLVELIRQAPDFPSSHNLYAELLAQAGDERGAGEQRRLGAAAGRFRAAEDPWLREFQSVCFDLERLIEWGEIDLQTRQGDRGRSAFERVVQLAPENVRGYERLGACYLAINDPVRAIDLLERGSRLPDATERLFSSLCDAYNARHDPAGELRAAEAGLRRWPQTSVLHNGRGHALAGLQRFDEAVAEFNLAIAAAPFAADPVANLGDVLLQQGRNPEAKAAFRQALELQPLHSKALVMLASLELEDGELEMAAPRIRALFEKEPDAAGSRKLVVELYRKQTVRALRTGALAEAEQAGRAGLALVPDSPELAGLLGAVYLQGGRLPEAARLLDISHKLRPDDPRVTITLGDVTGRLGRFDEARRLLAEGAGQARQLGEAGLAAQADDLLQALAGR